MRCARVAVLAAEKPLVRRFCAKTLDVRRLGEPLQSFA